ncbi:hypothetical protein RhiirA4_516652 [Rhizophagus irregularis]|uniref:Uncharacterized protein n=1 Tax=Rhizophagus irregularis TaxID=588596 RepID=A0A2I1HLY2_9GLOM|nr:hypothetical protein RhiirA4_516652 [Rhizophagus irregularis]
MSVKPCLDPDGISKERATFLIQQVRFAQPVKSIVLFMAWGIVPQHCISQSFLLLHSLGKDIFDKQSQIDVLNVLEATRNQKCEEYVDKISTYGNEEELAEEDITQEDVLNSVSEVSDTFRKTKFPVYYEKLKSIWHTRDAEANYYIIDMGDEETLNQVHELLSDNKLNFLSERLSLTDENECISTEARRYMILFDEIIEEGNYDDDDIEGENNDITDERNSEEFEKAITKMKRKVHQLDSLSKKFYYLSNTFPIPAESYDQSETPDIFVIKSVSSHLDTITKMNGLMRNTPERIWTAHVGPLNTNVFYIVNFV